MLKGKAISQLNKPSSTPSPTNSRITCQEEAPMARITPISRRRSSTLSERMPLKPTPPTRAMTMAITARSCKMMANPSPAPSVMPAMVFSPKVLVGATEMPLCSSVASRLSATPAWNSESVNDVCSHKVLTRPVNRQSC